MSNGHIHHGSIHGAEHKPSPRFYKAELESDIAVRSLTFCPFGGEQFILAGCDDGSVRLHSVTSEKPLITWPGTVDGQPILQIIWSPSRLVDTYTCGAYRLGMVGISIRGLFWGKDKVCIGLES